MPDQRLYYLINRAQHHLRKLVDRISLDRVGVSSAQVGALFLIAQRAVCTQADIAAELGQDESAITTMLAHNPGKTAARDFATRCGNVPFSTSRLWHRR